MPQRSVSLRVPRGSVAADDIRQRIDHLLATHDDLPQSFPTEVLDAAQRVAQWEPRAGAHVDMRDLPFVTLDPAHSTDLDQAMLLERTSQGYRVRYAIADVPLFVELEGAIDHEARRRGTTIYLPDRRIPLHPEELSEAAASLLPGQDTPAFVWDFALDHDGRLMTVALERAVVRSVAKLAYDAVQEQLDAGNAPEMMVLLQEIGAKRSALEAERGGASLNVPEQEVRSDGERLTAHWRSPAGIEAANAQISLLAGMAAAQLMLDGGVGILRTMPPADEAAMNRFRRQAQALQHPWDEATSYGDFLRGLDWTKPHHVALLNQATTLFRGAAYEAFTSVGDIPENTHQAALAAPYAHTTAPLRRLVDRFVLLCCWHHGQGLEVPQELREALPLIPDIMRETSARHGQIERAAQNLVDEALLATWQGASLAGTVIDRREGKSNDKGEQTSPTRIEVQVLDPPLVRWVEGDAPLGTEVTVTVRSEDDSAQMILTSAQQGDLPVASRRTEKPA